MKNGKTTMVLAMLLVAATTQAQTDSINKLSVGLDLMTHGELCGGGLPRHDNRTQALEDQSQFLYGRTRLIVDYERPGLHAHAVVQNGAVWGMSGNQSLNLYEGWAKVTAKNGLFAQMGRVALAYDDERIIGPNDFATAANSHDVLRVGYEGHGHKAHALFAYNQNGDDVYSGTYYVNGAQLYKTMQALWYHYDVPTFPLSASLLFMNMGLQAGKNDPVAWDYATNSPRTEHQQLFGGYLNYHSKYLTLEGTYYRQTGKMVDATSMASMKIRSWMASAKATIMPTEQYGFTLGYDYLSGDDFVPVVHGGQIGMPRHSVNKGFTPLYGSRTKFYGIMDYFYESAYIFGFTPGLQNAFVGVNARPWAKLDCSATYHYLAVATKLHNLDRTLGHTIDVQASYQLTKDISLMAGYTLMMGTDTMERLKQENSSKQAHWAWFTVAFSPSLFTAKW